MSDTTPPTSEATEPTAPSTPVPDPDSFAVRLGVARAAAGLSQRLAGVACKVSLTTFFKWEHGQSEPSPQKQAAVLRKLREAVKPAVVAAFDPAFGPDTTVVATVKDGVIESVESHQTAATPEELAHDPHEPVTDGPDYRVANQQPIPDIPIGNVHTSQDGVIRRRLADDDEREGAELIDGRKWFIVGFAPPHPRAKATVKPIAVKPTEPSPAPIPATQEASVAPTHTEATPKAPEPVAASSEPAMASYGKRGWSWWN